jgi:probable rRNA maturation factor
MEILVHNLDEQLGITNENITDLIKHTIKKIKLDIHSCQVIFVDDEKLRKMHEHYLNDPDYTDVITFNLGEDSAESEIYISIDRVKENANIFEVSIKNEVYRNIIHGLLHLKGYTDKKDYEKSIMKQKEEELLKQVQIL